MLINWFTVVAQIINFLVLVWLLKRFLYKPVLNAIAAREKKIATQLEDAAAKEAAAAQTQQQYKQQQTAFESKRAALLQEAEEAAGRKGAEMLEEARSHYGALQVQLETALKEKEQQIGNEIRTKTQQEVFAIAKKTLADLASAKLEDQMVKVFLEKMDRLSDDEWAALQTSLQRSSGSPVLQSAFEMNAEQKAAIEKKLRGKLGSVVAVDCQTAPALICGIALLVDGYKIAWNIEDYLKMLEKKVSGMLTGKKETSQN